MNKKIYIKHSKIETAINKLRGLKSGTVIYVESRMLLERDYYYFEQQTKLRNLVVKLYNRGCKNV